MKRALHGESPILLERRGAKSVACHEGSRIWSFSSEALSMTIYHQAKYWRRLTLLEAYDVILSERHRRHQAAPMES